MDLRLLKLNTQLLFDGIQLQGAIHAGGGEILCMLPESHTCGQCCVIVEYLQVLPLFAQVNPANVNNKNNQCSIA